MVIAFSCPHCGEPYRLKDDLAGKTAKCKRQTCRQVMSVPAPTPDAPVRSSEEVAAAVLIEANKAESQVQTELAMTCKFCDHPFTVEMGKAGKNVPCPECARLNKAPIPKVETSGDWRLTGSDKPSLARRDTEPVLEGAWKGGETTIASGQSILAAGAGPKIEYEPLAASIKVKRAALVLGLAVLLVSGVIWLRSARTAGTQNRTFRDSLNEVMDADHGTKRKELHAAIHRLVGEAELSLAKDLKSCNEALAHLRKAHNLAAGLSDRGADRPLILCETARAFARAGGTPEQLDAQSRISWGKTQQEMQRTLSDLPPGEIRLWALRQAARALSEFGEGHRACDLAREVVPDNLAEAAGQVGTELLKIGKTAQAEEALKKADGFVQGRPELAAKAPAYTALKLALAGQTTLPAGSKGIAPPPPSGPTDDLSRFAYAEAYALQGKQAEALAIANKGGSVTAKLRALMLVASATAEGENAAQAAPILEAALPLLAADPRTPPALRLQLSYLLARVGKHELALSAAETPDAGWRAWARLEALRGRLAANPTSKAEEGWLSKPAKPDDPLLAEILEREWYARRNARLKDSALKKLIDSWPKPAVAPFGQAASLLGESEK